MMVLVLSCLHSLLCLDNSNELRGISTETVDSIVIDLNNSGIKKKKCNCE